MDEATRYEPLQLLGEGGFARVFRARDSKLKRDVALKRLIVERKLSREALARFRREAEVLARLSHPNIVAIYDHTDEPPAIVMELVEGEPLSALLARGLEHRQGLAIVEKVARAVHHAHGHGIVHRDLKPQNILVGPAFEPKVADFGIARLADAELRLTRTGTFLGSPAYMAPEQALGEVSRIDARTDVYALGAVLYEVLVGAPPYAEEPPETLILYKTRKEVEAPDPLDAAVPREALAIALRALARDPERRHPTAEAMADEIARFLEGRALVPSRWKWPALVGLCVVVVAVAVTLRRPDVPVALHPEPRPRPAPKPPVAPRPWPSPRRGHAPTDGERADAANHMERARQALRQGAIALTVTEVIRVIELDPENWEAWLALSRVEHLAGDDTAAYKALDDGIAFFEDHARELAKRPGDGFGILQAQVANDQALYEIFFQRARLDRTVDPKQAPADFERARKIAPIRSEVRTEYARFILESEKDPRRALQELGEPASDDWQGLHMRSRVKLELGETDGALADAEAAVAHAPTGPHPDGAALVLTQRGRARRAKGDKALALADLEEAFRLVSDDSLKAEIDALRAQR